MTSLSGRKKAAIVTVAMGHEYASKIYKHLIEKDIKDLSVEIARLSDVDGEILDDVLKEFYSLCLSKKMFAEGGIECAKQILEGAFGHKVADEYLKQIEEMMDSNSFNVIKELNEKSLMTIIRDEHPQTIAFILSNAKPEQVSLIISKLPKEKGIDVISRIAKLDRISGDVLHEIEKLVAKKLQNTTNNNTTRLDGVKCVTSIINNVDRKVEKFILDGLSQIDPALSEEIMKRMFVFEDILLLDSTAIQRVLRDIDKNDLALAIKGSNEDIVEFIFANVSQRMVENIKEDISYMKNVKLSDVEAAQQKIVQHIRELEKLGEISVDKSGEDDAVG